ALIGEEEAAERIKSYITLLNQNEVDYISIKASTIYSQIESIAHDQVVNKLVEKLSILYREVLKIEKEKRIEKFVNLDMEEYRDLTITLDTFKKTLDQPEFQNLRAGIVLQAYLPDSYREMEKLQQWAIKRVQNGGSPVKIRIVKGANLEMELTEASMESWNLAPYDSKLKVDANFKRMLLLGISPDGAPALNIGVASHNTFDLAFALTLVKENQLEQFVDFEMLEGVAGRMPFEIKKHNVNVILYTPIVKSDNYSNAIAYLVRRLDEGTQPGNFLREEINLKIDTQKWNEMSDLFVQSILSIDSLQQISNRTQDRNTIQDEPQEQFSNAINTDWTSFRNRLWIEQVRLRWFNPTNIMPEVIPVISPLSKSERPIVSQNNWEGELPWQYELATTEDYDTMLESDSQWYTYTIEQKAQMLRQAAIEMEKCRGDLIG
ncbi:MAG: bifunctional proline dehydrogenase/L-glutamate gamma-semialdehyde dehydrogenase, partial [Methylococcales bacterium]|nr:bifunctional proline dehydrogenase/L-glutamate gamma-semialdehyde dehydrogenase [Methylococcales bacterium]